MSFTVGAIEDPRTYTTKLAHWWSAGSGHSKGVAGVEKIRSLNQGKSGVATLGVFTGAAPTLVSNGLLFDGASKMAHGTPAGMALGSSPGMLVAFAANSIALESDYPCYFYTAVTGDGLTLRTGSGAVSGHCADDVGNTTVSSGVTIAADNSWHIALVERQGSNIAISVDGGAFATAACAGTIDIGGGGNVVPLSVGGNSASLAFSGSISDAFVFDANLTGGETDLFKAYLNAKHGTAF